GGTMVLATGVAGEVASYVVLFVLVFLGGAGVPVIGTAAVTATAILASQGTLSIDDVIGVGSLAAVLRGLLGYYVGCRWGFEGMGLGGDGTPRSRREATPRDARSRTRALRQVGLAGLLLHPFVHRRDRTHAIRPVPHLQHDRGGHLSVRDGAPLIWCRLAD